MLLKSHLVCQPFQLFYLMQGSATIELFPNDIGLPNQEFNLLLLLLAVLLLVVLVLNEILIQ